VINRYRAARAEVDKIAVREPMLPNGHPADETEEYARWEKANLKATDAASTAWAERRALPPPAPAYRGRVPNAHDLVSLRVMQV
jgi:hypothetical protein